MQRGSAGRHPWLSQALAIAVAGCALAACGAPAPSVDATRVIHIENRVRQAVMVEIDVSSQSDSRQYLTAVRPCAGDLSLTFGVQIPAVANMDHWVVFLLADPTGSFDSALAEWTKDPVDMPGHFTSTILWSHGYDLSQSLPMWVAMTADGGVVRDAPMAAAEPSACPSLDLTQ